MTSDQENERNERWLEQLLDGVRNSNQSAEDVAQRCYLLTHPSAMSVGDLAQGIVERIDHDLHAEREATEQAAADLGDRLARIGKRGAA